MANNENEIVDSDTKRTKQRDSFIYLDNPDETNECLSTSENHKFFNKMLKYFMRSTARLMQRKKKKMNIRERSVSTLCKSEERLATCASLSSIVNNIIKCDTTTVAKIKRKMIDAITSTTQCEVLDTVTHENLSGVGRFVRDASYQYADYAAKMDNAMPGRGCGPLCGTQSDIVDRKFRILKISPDAFAKACEERRHSDRILEKIAKVSDALTEKARSVSAKEKAILASTSVRSRCKMGEETFEGPLISSCIYAEKRPIAVADAAVAVMQPETFMDPRILISSSSHFMPDSRSCSGLYLDKSVDTSDIHVTPRIKYLKPKHTRGVQIMFPKRDYFQDTAVTTVRKKKREEEESSKKLSLRLTSDKHVFAVDKKAKYEPVGKSVIINCIPKLKEKDSKSSYQPSDIKIDISRRKAVVKVDSYTKARIEKDARIVKESVPVKYKKPKYRDKYRSKEEKEKLSKALKEKLPKYECLFFTPPKISKSFDELRRPAMEMYRDCRTKMLRCLQPIGYCEDLIPSNICLRRPKYCDVWTIPCISSQNGATRSITLDRAICARSPQDSCVTEHRASCHSLINSPVSSRYYNVSNECAKRRVTFANLSCMDTYFKNEAKYCYPHLNNIGNVRTGYYHCNDSYPVWNNTYCGRDQLSCYWTKGYFTHPWTSEHSLRYNWY